MPRRASIAVLLGVILAILMAAPTWAAAPTKERFADPPSDDLVVDCGSYQIREVSTFSAFVLTFSDGSRRMHASIDGWLYRSDQPDVVIGHEHARTVRDIEGTVAQIRGNRWHIVLYGSGMTVHDVGRIEWDFVSGEVFAESGKHPVFDGTFDFSDLCSA